jgi:ribosomal protein S18 acetylase RimI-like enzyme
MLFEAFFWNAGFGRPSLEEFLKDPRFQLLENWGRRGDRSVIAEGDGKPIGAAWCRLWTAENHSYGFVDAETPEIGMAVEQACRSKGIGRALLRALVQEGRTQGLLKLSLSVDPSNFARQLYESEGFLKVGQSGTSWTYVKNLAG